MVLEIWNSFRRMPVWVQVWVALILVPVNIATLGFLGMPNGDLIAALAIFGMLPNLLFMMRERGFSKSMTVSHVLIWPFLLLAIVETFAQGPDLGNGQFAFLALLFVIDAISLAFDIPDVWKWYKGDRNIA